MLLHKRHRRGTAIVLADNGKEDLDFFKDMGFDVRKVSIDYNGVRGLSR